MAKGNFKFGKIIFGSALALTLALGGLTLTGCSWGKEEDLPEFDYENFLTIPGVYKSTELVGPDTYSYVKITLDDETLQVAVTEDSTGSFAYITYDGWNNISDIDMTPVYENDAWKIEGANDGATYSLTEYTQTTFTVVVSFEGENDMTMHFVMIDQSTLPAQEEPEDPEEYNWQNFNTNLGIYRSNSFIYEDEDKSEDSEWRYVYGFLNLKKVNEENALKIQFETDPLSGGLNYISDERWVNDEEEVVLEPVYRDGEWVFIGGSREEFDGHLFEMIVEISNLEENSLHYSCEFYLDGELFDEAGDNVETDLTYVDQESLPPIEEEPEDEFDWSVLTIPGVYKSEAYDHDDKDNGDVYEYIRFESQQAIKIAYDWIYPGDSLTLDYIDDNDWADDDFFVINNLTAEKVDGNWIIKGSWYEEETEGNHIGDYTLIEVKMYDFNENGFTFKETVSGLEHGEAFDEDLLILSMTYVDQSTLPPIEEESEEPEFDYSTFLTPGKVYATESSEVDDGEGYLMLRVDEEYNFKFNLEAREDLWVYDNEDWADWDDVAFVPEYVNGEWKLIAQTEDHGDIITYEILEYTTTSVSIKLSLYEEGSEEPVFEMTGTYTMVEEQ